MRFCKVCGIQKSLDCFHIRSKKTNTYRRECKDCHSKAVVERTYRPENIEKRTKWLNKYNQTRRRKQLLQLYNLKKYGLTLEQYQDLLIAHDYKCKICKRPHSEEHKKGLHIDHCHKTGKVRGLLCGPCNSVLGFSKDSVETLTKAIEYLKVYE